MPVHTQIRLDDGDHVVQLYDHDEDLVDVVAGYLAASVTGGDAVVVIATPSHLAAFGAALAAAGVEASAAEEEGRLVTLDAEDTVCRLMSSGTPDPAMFDAVVGGTIRALASGGRPVRAYGEMVAVLWEAGNRPGALELERLWNGLGATIPFALFCAYPSHLVDEGAIADVCTLHSRVVTGTPRVPGDHEVRRFARSPQTPRLTRRFVSDTLAGWGLHELVDDAAVVVTELAANAVTHANSDVTASVKRTGSGVRIAVGDRSSVPPAIRESHPDMRGGRGLVLVDNIAERWGHGVTDEGKVVWADLAVTEGGGG